MQRFGKDSNIYTFLLTYKKVIMVVCVLSLLFFIYKIFHPPIFESWERNQAIGYWLDTFFQDGLLPIVGLIYIHKAVKLSKSYEN